MKDVEVDAFGDAARQCVGVCVCVEFIPSALLLLNLQLIVLYIVYGEFVTVVVINTAATP